MSLMNSLLLVASSLFCVGSALAGSSAAKPSQQTVVYSREMQNHERTYFSGQLTSVIARSQDDCQINISNFKNPKLEADVKARSVTFRDAASNDLYSKSSLMALLNPLGAEDQLLPQSRVSAIGKTITLTYTMPLVSPRLAQEISVSSTDPSSELIVEHRFVREGESLLHWRWIESTARLAGKPHVRCVPVGQSAEGPQSAPATTTASVGVPTKWVQTLEYRMRSRDLDKSGAIPEKPQPAQGKSLSEAPY